MKEDLFIAKHTESWRQLEALAERLEKKGLKSLKPEEARVFLHLFRTGSHHLAFARTRYPDSDLVKYLNALIGKCQTHVYAVRRAAPEELWAYLKRGYPRCLRLYRGFIAASLAAFLAGALLGGGLVVIDVENAAFFLPDGLLEAIKSGQMGSGEWNYPLMSSVIMVNNISVSLTAFVAGITFGLGTLYILFQNGALLGALTAAVYLYGDPLRYWSLILPHGILELSAIFISGASGLLIARGLLLPGELSRLHGLVKGAKEAASLLFGVVLMLVVAGIIEGFFTPLDIDPTLKLAFAAATAALLLVYYCAGNRGGKGVRDQGSGIREMIQDKCIE